MELKGLTSEEVKERLDKGLSNHSSKPKTKTIKEIFVSNIFSLFNYIIFGIIAFVLFYYFKNKDERLLLDSIGILTIAFTNTFIAIYQEIKSKKALDKVNLLLKKKINVIRGGQVFKIDVTDIVVDDLIQVNRGDQIVVDGKVVKAKILDIDESLLTGESVPVEKSEGDSVLSGSFCVSGNGVYRAEKVGDKSYANSVTTLAKKMNLSISPLQKKINLILKLLFGFALILTGVEIIAWYANPKIEFVDFIRKIATILISLVPQGLVLMASVTYAVGVYRISKIGAIVQKLNAIESFSNVQVVCMDKTGTLTENKLRIHSFTNLSDFILDEEIKLLLGSYAYNSSDKNATIMSLDEFEHYKKAECIEELPFNSSNKLSILKLKIKEQTDFYILGAFDILTEKLSGEKKSDALKAYEGKGLNIYRNLLFGKVLNIDSVKDAQNKLNELDIEPISIISITDTVRKDVYEALDLFNKNGIGFKILSGDSGEAIMAVLNEIGWKINIDQITSGNELDKLTKKEFRKVVLSKQVFARLKPEHKLEIIMTLKKEKIYTAMIGDGVNDLPAIKKSDMGIAMEEGSAITKEVADIILLKNKFSLLPEIFDEGNKIVNTVNSVAKLFLTKNFLVIYLSLLSLIFMLDFPLTPRRVSLLNVFAIGLPAFILTLKNKNVSKCLNFIKDTFSYVGISSTIIIAGGYIGYYIVSRTTNSSGSELDMVMVTIIIFISVMNFIIVALETREKNIIYFLYGVLLLFIYIFLATTNIPLSFITLLKIFYEIEHINPEHWWVIFNVSFISSVLLYIIHKIRVRFFI
ncbi:MAG: HAD-IC family P-type ATPase [Ignavibacteriae bacterium]|nr:HAD-IC family P-type ATPase [Ignavibacteriota bacterium]